MFGRTSVLETSIILISLLASFSDIRFNRIYNGLTVPAAILGFFYCSATADFNGCLQSLMGFLMGLLLFGWMFHFRVLGGGDVKLLMAFGAWGGPHYVLEVAILSVLLGGGFSLVILIATGRILGFLKRMYWFFLTLFVKEFEIQLPKIDKSLKMPFGVPISISAVWIIFAHPLDKWL